MKTVVANSTLPLAAAPRFVGVQEVYEALGISRSTLDRLRRDKAFPEATQLSPNRVGWTLEILNEWANERSMKLTRLAVADPEQLEPGEMLETAQELILKSIEMQGGETAGLDSIAITLSREMTAEQFCDLQIRELAIWGDRVAALPEHKALVVAAWMFPHIRRMFLDADLTSCGTEFRALLGDDHELELVAAHFLREELEPALERVGEIRKKFADAAKRSAGA